MEESGLIQSFHMLVQHERAQNLSVIYKCVILLDFGTDICSVWY